MEGKKIIAVHDFNQAYQLVAFEDGSGMLVKMVTELSADDMADLGNVALGPEDEPATTKEEETTTTDTTAEEPEAEEPTGDEEPAGEPEGEDDAPEDVTEEEIMEADFDGLIDICEDLNTETNPDDFDDDQLEDLRTALLIEFGFKTEEEEPEPETDPEPSQDDTITWDELKGMDFEELGDVCNDEKLETDPEDYDAEDEDKFRKAIATELGIEVPETRRRRRGK